MNYRTIQDKTIELLIDYEINKVPIDIDHLMDKMGIVRVPYSDLGDRGMKLSKKCAKDGYYDFCSETSTFYIYYDDTKVKTRLKFTFGHEIRHIINLDSYETDDIRIKANYFSRFLLVPIPLLIEIGVSNESELIYIFDVSPDVAHYSLDYLKWHKSEYATYTENEKILIENFSNEIIRCKKALMDYREKMNIPDFSE